jgi:hypothetical protein
MNDLINFIQAVGFPIVSFFVMVWLNVKIISRNTEAINNLTLHLKNGKECK